MFEDCKNLKSIDLSNLKTENIKDISEKEENNKDNLELNNNLENPEVILKIKTNLIKSKSKL